MKNRLRAAIRVATLAAGAFVITIGSAHAANWYVRPNGGAYGSTNGSDWNNAFNGFSDIAWSSVACGDTIWVAGGTYTQDLVPTKTGCTSSNQLFIRRARSDASAATSAAGWSSSFDSQVHQVSGTISFGAVDWITVSGRTTAAGGANGWFIDFRGQTSGTGINFEHVSGRTNNTFEFMDIQGPGQITYSGDGRGIDATPTGSGCANNKFSHLKIWDWESTIYHTLCSGTIFEYLELFNVGAVNAATYHPNGLYVVGSNNITVRYSYFHQGTTGSGIGEGIFFEQSGGSSNWAIYGNVFANLQYRSIQITSPVPGMKIYNNTFYNSNPAIQVRTDQGGSCGSGSETRDNIFYSSPHDTCGTESSNLAQSSPNPFINAAGGDFHIVNTVGTGYPRNAGVALASPYNLDPDGDVRGADGGWDLGAYEGDCTSCSPTPGAPSNVRLTQ